MHGSTTYNDLKLNTVWFVDVPNINTLVTMNIIFFLIKGQGWIISLKIQYNVLLSIVPSLYFHQTCIFMFSIVKKKCKNIVDHEKIPFLTGLVN